ncbi:anthranilate phosphoribosyltransferase [Actinokineospora alba]|uniref:Anthranilate phosphoribosyltransferase n=1 Tax=Actinokineospora alba TaxID=504798 RepID=A0A1H0R6Q9_9PSEU|nr:hypothetical protein [Actinokineospora alba]TDP70224.1 anthranilate phosphoribosyltransferase [Actinokineospora alba]SDI36463.1 anthranilate phosphoribosyltransferase [Actinokineospora alba]SDP25174.1 anthranilate phosphoribosyltransferase [Actinokineospora alba]
MSDLLVELTRREHPVDMATWRSFLDRLRARRLTRGEAAAVLTSLTTAMPDDLSLTALFDALAERRTADDEFPGAVNIVGTGGGPRTFNVSTAAAIVAAAMGVRVLKTGSRAYTSRVGSFDLLDRLGIGLADSAEQAADALDRFGVAFAGYFVYPPEIAMLAREVLPLDVRVVGRFINTVGPFLAQVSVPAQFTGVSRRADLTALRALAVRTPRRRTWLCANEIGADEALSFADNVIHRCDRGDVTEIGPATLPLHAGDLRDLAPPADLGAVADHFRGVLAGDAPPAAVQTVCLNAATLAVLSGAHATWNTAFDAAETAVRDGAATDLLARLSAGDRTAVAHG